MIRALAFAALFAVVAFPVAAQTAGPVARASASITIERPLTISTLRPMMFGPTVGDRGLAGGTGAGEAVIRVTGDPGRVYRVTLPRTVVAQPGNLSVETVSIISDNAGDITTSLSGRMDASGVDRLRISGWLRPTSEVTLQGVTAAVPVGVDYE